MGQVTFEVAAYDHSKPLIIDPVLIYASYLGGSGNEDSTGAADNYAGIAVDSMGSAYVTGDADFNDFPTLNPYQAQNNGAPNIFITKFTPDGFGFVYSTYLGGSNGEFRGRHRGPIRGELCTCQAQPLPPTFRCNDGRSARR